MKISDIENLSTQDISKLTKSDAIAILKKEKQVLLRRSKTLRSKNLHPAELQGENQSRKIKTTNLNRNQAISEVIRTTKILKSKTTTVTGYRKYIKRQTKLLTGQTKKLLSEKTLNKVYEIYNKINEIHPNAQKIADYKSILKDISTNVKKYKLEKDILKAVEKTIQQEYEITINNELSQSEWEKIF